MAHQSSGWKVQVSCVALVAVVAGCGLPTRQDVDMAQTVFELGTAVQDMREGQLDLQERVDSLTVLVGRQDSTIRALANLLGAPLPPR
ncbi:MAG: hypothetical protein IT361_06910 [Gemmatimonadaceae bacterium]|nr:hypothetical protein [Gemmatimonadaceae bacterium]